MRPSLFFISAVLLLVTYHLGKTLYFGSDWASSRCDKIELATADSPDLRRQAKAVQFGCGDGFASNDWVTVVVVERGRRWPTERDEVLRVDSGWEDGGKLRWQGNDVLEISITEKMHIERRTQAAENVTTEILVVPASLAAREKYYCEKGELYQSLCARTSAQVWDQLHEAAASKGQ
jgi:hypothetical protein